MGVLSPLHSVCFCIDLLNWPICHLPVLVNYLITTLIQADDIIWIHDYHMIPMARDLRRLGVKNRIGFFLHTPWPVRQLLVTLPHHRRLVEAMFDYDLIGFQTREWLDLFRDYVASEPSVRP